MFAAPCRAAPAPDFTARPAALGLSRADQLRRRLPSRGRRVAGRRRAPVRPSPAPLPPRPRSPAVVNEYAGHIRKGDGALSQRRRWRTHPPAPVNLQASKRRPRDLAQLNKSGWHFSDLVSFFLGGGSQDGRPRLPNSRKGPEIVAARLVGSTATSEARAAPCMEWRGVPPEAKKAANITTATHTITGRRSCLDVRTFIRHLS